MNKINKRGIALVLILTSLLFLLTLSGCEFSKQKDEISETIEAITTLEQLNQSGIKIGVPSGSKPDEAAREHFPNAEIMQYRNIGEGFVALKTGKIDGFCFTKNIMQYVVSKNPDLRLIDEAIDFTEMVVGVRLDDTELMAEINAVIKTLNENGVRAEMEARWFNDADFNPAMPHIEPAANPTKKLIIGIPDENPPMSYTNDDGVLIGYDAECGLRLGKELNAEVEFQVMEWPAIIPSLQSGRVDVIISNLNITEERKQVMLMSEVYAATDIVMMVRNESETAHGLQGFSVEAFQGKKIAVTTGTVLDKIIAEYIPGAESTFFNNPADAIEAVKTGRVDAVIDDDATLRRYVAANPGMRILQPYVTHDEYGVITSKESDGLLDSLNEFIEFLKSSGTYDDMLSRWLDTETTLPMPEIPEGEGEVLKFGTSGIVDGFSYYRNNEISGFDIEFAKRFAAFTDRKLEISVIEFGGLIPAVQSGKIDFAASLFTITEERQQSVNFTVPYYIGGTVLAVYESPQTAETQSFLQSLKTGFERNLLHENRWKMLVDGLLNSIVITLFAFALATLLGFGVCGLKMSGNVILRGIGKAYITVLRGTPIVVLLMIAFYVIFAKSSMSAVMVAVIAFGANGAAFIGEIIHSAILTVDKGQVEAARSMGFGKIATFFTVTFPQAVRVAFPVYMSEFISLFKMTAVVGYIAVMDLTKAGDIIRSRTYDAFFPLLFVALVYLVTASLMIFLFSRIERFTNKRLRSQRRK